MEFFLFAGLMALDMLLFFYLAARYTYVKVEKDKDVDDDEKKVPAVSEEPLSTKPAPEDAEKYTGSENKGFSDDTPM